MKKQVLGGFQLYLNLLLGAESEKIKSLTSLFCITDKHLALALNMV